MKGKKLPPFLAMKKHGKEGSAAEEASESKAEAMREGDEPKKKKGKKLGY